MADRYEEIVRSVKARYGIRVRRWRSTMSGCAWRGTSSSGRLINWIEAPRPKTPLSLAIFLHEVGHHVIGFERFGASCEEEYHVWLWALAAMRGLGIEPDGRTERRFRESMRYAVGKSLRRDPRPLPVELENFATPLAA